MGGAFPVHLGGSTYEYLTPSGPAGGLTYALKISRDCGDELFCLELEAPDCTGSDAGDDTQLGIAFQRYLEPATRVGPAFPQIVHDRIITFTPVE